MKCGVWIGARPWESTWPNRGNWWCGWAVSSMNLSISSGSRVRCGVLLSAIAGHLVSYEVLGEDWKGVFAVKISFDVAPIAGVGVAPVAFISLALS
jgi:hypothetical protein